MTILSNKPTGRRWGDKLPEKAGTRVIDGVKYRFAEFDAWEGPLEPGQQGEYHRIVTGEPMERLA